MTLISSTGTTRGERLRRRLLVASLLAGLAVNPAVAVEPAGPALFVPLTSMAAVRPVWGDVRVYAEPRGRLGRDEAEPAHRRGAAVGAGSNAVFDVGPLVFPAQPLRLNGDVSHGDAALSQQAYLMVEVLDAEGRPLAPYAKERCLLADVNDLARPLSWTGANTTPLVGTKVILRFHARDARLYSLHTVPLPGTRSPASLHDTSEAPPLPRITVQLPRTELAAWDSVPLAVEARTPEGRFAPLDRRAVEWVVEPAGTPLQILPDKRDPNLAYATVAGDLAASSTVSISVRLQRGARTAHSDPVALTLRPARSERGRERKILSLFMRPGDVTETSGPVEFNAGTLTPYAETRGLPTTPKAMALYGREIDGRYHVWGSSRESGGLYRAETADGINYERLRPLDVRIPPEHFFSLVYNPREDRYLALERAFGPSQFRAHVSIDGTHFTPAGPGPAFVDHDGAHLLWDERENRYISIGLTYQQLPRPRRFIDNLAWQEHLGGSGLRRVFAVRTSPDGVRWTPDTPVVQRDPAGWLPARHLLAPDAADPEDLEFYWFLAFRHHDRWVAIALTYAPSPFNVLERTPYDPYPSKHGPHLDTEWWLSDDGVRWERPFRGTPATLDWRIYFGHAPLRRHDRLLFLTSNQLFNLPPAYGARPGQNLQVYSLPLDRIASAGSSAPAGFTSRTFFMPADGLALNYASEGSLAVELLDEQGRVVPGYGRADGRLPVGDRVAEPLRWAGRTGSELAGRRLTLRCWTERARVYALYAE